MCRAGFNIFWFTFLGAWNMHIKQSICITYHVISHFKDWEIYWYHLYASLAFVCYWGQINSFSHFSIKPCSETRFPFPDQHKNSYLWEGGRLWIHILSSWRLWWQINHQLSVTRILSCMCAFIRINLFQFNALRLALFWHGWNLTCRSLTQKDETSFSPLGLFIFCTPCVCVLAFISMCVHFCPVLSV